MRISSQNPARKSLLHSRPSAAVAIFVSFNENDWAVAVIELKLDQRYFSNDATSDLSCASALSYAF